jgi:hypothetical protein
MRAADGNSSRWRRGGSTSGTAASVDTVAFLVHMQINVSTPEEFFFFPIQRGVFERKRS